MLFPRIALRFSSEQALRRDVLSSHDARDALAKDQHHQIWLSHLEISIIHEASAASSREAVTMIS